MATKAITMILNDVIHKKVGIKGNIAVVIHRECAKYVQNRKYGCYRSFRKESAFANGEVGLLQMSARNIGRPSVVYGTPHLGGVHIHGISIVRTMAGHSHWANIKFKKMHKDVERSKIFGKLSLEIINAVRENGPDIATNSKLDTIISRAKAAKMPKDSIESAIKSALRAGNEERTQMLFEVRGPGRCGILLDVLSPNLKRSRPEINTILKKNDGILCEEGSVSFMFEHKGVITVEDVKSATVTSSKIEEAAILSGAECYHFTKDKEGRSIIQFLCDVMDLKSVEKALTSEHCLNVIAATEERIAINLVELNDDVITRADKLIERLSVTS